VRFSPNKAIETDAKKTARLIAKLEARPRKASRRDFSSHCCS